VGLPGSVDSRKTLGRSVELKMQAVKLIDSSKSLHRAKIAAISIARSAFSGTLFSAVHKNVFVSFRIASASILHVFPSPYKNKLERLKN
jgi:hypothetical protein